MRVKGGNCAECPCSTVCYLRHLGGMLSYVDPLPEGDELVDGRGSIDVSGHQKHLLGLLLLLEVP